MRPSSAKFLEDIREAARTVQEITSERLFADYQADKVLRLAVERCFEIIGEAMRRLDESDHDTAAKVSDFQRIISFRNVLIHGYSLVKHDLVWSVVEIQVPRLITEIEGLLAATRKQP